MACRGLLKFINTHSDFANWDVEVHSRDAKTWDLLEPVHAQHGPSLRSTAGKPREQHRLIAMQALKLPGLAWGSKKRRQGRE